MESVFSEVSSDEDDDGSGQTKRSRPNEPTGIVLVQEGSHPIFYSKQLPDSDKKESDNQSSDELEIKIETIEEADTAQDPLQLNEKPQISINSSKSVYHSSVMMPRKVASITGDPSSSSSVKTILGNYLSQKNVVANPTIKQGSIKRSIVLRKLINLPDNLLKQIKSQNVKKLKFLTKEGEGKTGGASTSKVTVTAKNIITLNSMEESITYNSNNLSCSTVTEEKEKKDIVIKNINTSVIDKHNIADTSSSENDVVNNGDVNKHQRGDEVNEGSLCKVNGCTGMPSHYFKVPQEERKLKIWRYCLRNQKVQKGDLICEQHFIPQDILIRPTKHPVRILKEFAVPSLQKVLVGCCMPQCTNKIKNFTNMYPIPIWGLYTHWISKMGEIKAKIGSLHDLLQFRVCESHFSLECLERKFEMVPTLNLPSKGWYEGRLQNYLQKRGQDPTYKSNSATIDEVDVRESLSLLHSDRRTEVDKNEVDFCAYFGCAINKETAYYKFYEFPSDYSSAIKWLEACNRKDILRRAYADIQYFITNSIGLCFKHKNDVEKIIRKNQMSNLKVETSKSGSSNSKSTITVFEGKTGVGKLGENKNTSTIVNVEEKSVENSQMDTNKEMYVPVREYCAFINCSTHIKDVVRKYRFPADEELLSLWIEAAGIPTTLLEDEIRTLFVCGKHFNKSQYNEMGTLILSSVPESHIEFEDVTPHEGNEHWIMKQRKTKSCKPADPMASIGDGVSFKSHAIFTINKALTSTASITKAVMNAASTSKTPSEINTCVVKHCKSNITTSTLYPFPNHSKDIDRFVGWLKAVENQPAASVDSMATYTRKKICDRHFEKQYQIGNTLLRKDAMPTLDLVEDIPEKEKDTSIIWKPCESNICDTDKSDSNAPYIKGNAILRSSSIEFPNMNRELRFGKDCPRMGKDRFPFKLVRMAEVTTGREVTFVNPGHKLQIHTAIIVDDNDESEREAISTISKLIMSNTRIVQKRGPRGRRLKNT